MKRVSTVKLCNILCILFTFGFVINTIVDYVNYSNTLNSAPFRLWVYINLVSYMLPAFIVFAIGRSIKKKQKKIEAEKKESRRD